MKLLKNGYEIEGTAEEVFLLLQMETKYTEFLEKKEKPKKPAQKKPARKPLEKDMGKVKALRDAGWSLEKIADEFGVSPMTVSNWMKKEAKA